MSAPQKRRGLRAVGSSSRFFVEIDEDLDDASKLEFQIDSTSWAFRFKLTGSDVAMRMLSFLRERSGRLEFSEMAVGTFHGAPVLLVKDDEFPDRFWLRAIGDGEIVEFTVAGEDVGGLIDALAQAVHVDDKAARV